VVKEPAGVDAPQRVTITVENFAPADLHGAMLRKSFSRPANRALFWPAIQSLIAAFLTAGLLPTGFLLWRLWLYATHQRFRAGDLAKWLRASDPPQFDYMIRPILPAVFNLRSVRPTSIFIVAAVCWLTACAMPIISLAAAGGLIDISPRARDLLLVLFFALISAAAMALLATILALRMRVHGYFARPDLKSIAVTAISVDPNLPLWTLWPALLSPLAVIAKLLDSRLAALWVVAALVAMLAAEVQRGYITVADRRLRYTVARAIAALMWSERKNR
jgi:hypothetical protein